MDSWQDISTAPRDRQILVWNAFMGVYQTRFLDGEWPCVMMHATASGLSETPARWDIDDPNRESRVGVWYSRPTKWQPLHAPPGR